MAFLTDKEAAEVKRIAVAKAGRKGRFHYMTGELTEWAIGMKMNLTPELTDSEKAIVKNFVEKFGDVPSKDREAIRSAFSALQREVRKIHGEKASLTGTYAILNENPAYVVERTK